MRSFGLFFLSSALLLGQLSSYEVTNPFVDSNCQCNCDCSRTTPDVCSLDLYVVLDAAVCVKDVWGEMKNRVTTMIRTLDEEYGVGKGRLRVSVISYAKSASVDIPLTPAMDYNDVANAISMIDYKDEGSYLSSGIELLTQQMEQNKVGAGSRSKAAIFITNGKSHPTVMNKDVYPMLDLLRTDVRQGGYGAKLFFNTLVPIQDHLYTNCQVCDFNRKLLVDLMDMEIRTINDDNEYQELIHGSIISKNKLIKLFMIEMNFMCPPSVVDAEFCDNCVCICNVPEGPVGPPGPDGYVGAVGCDGCDGRPGNPGKDGKCGVNGPNGVPGLPGKPGSPGHHGQPGYEGPQGPEGHDGGPGVQGSHGNPGPIGGVGYTGVAGLNGVKGADGSSGPEGKTGKKGQTGPRGVKGRKGPMGATGIRGPRGGPGASGPSENGQRGPRGFTGKTGDDGNRGNNGPKGERGFTGRQGPQGAAGHSAKDGPLGYTGITGNPGAVGATGGLGVARTEQEVRAHIRTYLEALLPRNGDWVKNNGYTCFNKGSRAYNDILKSLIGMSIAFDNDFIDAPIDQTQVNNQGPVQFVMPDEEFFPVEIEVMSGNPNSGTGELIVEDNTIYQTGGGYQVYVDEDGNSSQPQLTRTVNTAQTGGGYQVYVDQNGNSSGSSSGSSSGRSGSGSSGSSSSGSSSSGSSSSGSSSSGYSSSGSSSSGSSSSGTRYYSSGSSGLGSNSSGNGSFMVRGGKTYSGRNNGGSNSYRWEYTN